MRMEQAPTSISPEQTQRFANILQRFRARFVPRPEVVTQIAASPLWQMLCHPLYPSSAAVICLADGEPVLMTPYIHALRDEFGDRSTLATTLSVIHHDDTDALIVFLESIEHTHGIHELNFRYSPNGLTPQWMNLLSTPLDAWFPGADCYILLVIHNITASRPHRGSNVVEWSSGNTGNWKTLFPLPRALNNPLTPRELEVLRYLAKGWGSRRIAEHLGLSTYTVDTHRSNMLLKTGCSNTPDLVRFGLESGLV